MTNNELPSAIQFSANMVAGLVHHFATDTMRRATGDEIPTDVRCLFMAQLARLLNVQAQRAEKGAV